MSDPIINLKQCVQGTKLVYLMILAYIKGWLKMVKTRQKLQLIKKKYKKSY